MDKKRFSSLVCSLLFSAVACAAPHQLSMLPAGWVADAYLDGSYSYLLRSNQFTSGVYNRVYDLNPDGVALHQASLTVDYQPKEGMGGLVNPILGYDSLIFAPYGWDPYIGLKQIGFAIPQGYLYYGHDALTVIGGSFNTLVGADFLDPTKDHNFSRTILWGFAEPATHLGVRGTYEVNPQLKVIAGLNNGWDTIRDTGRHKTLELSVVCTPHKRVSLALAGYSGGQRATDRTDYGPIGTRNLLDTVLTLALVDKLDLVLNYDYGTQSIAALPEDLYGTAVWKGLATYLNYHMNDQWIASLRGEIFDDVNGYRTGVVQQWKEVTVTIGYQVVNYFELRAEARHDLSNVASFLKANGQGTSHNQQSFALEGVLKWL